MSTLFTILPVLLGFALLTAIAKLAAWLYRRSTLKWRHAASYVFLLFVGSIIFGVLNKLGGSTSPLPLVIGASLAFHILLGGWYLGSRSRGADGCPLTFPRGAILLSSTLASFWSSWASQPWFSLPFVGRTDSNASPGSDK